MRLPRSVMVVAATVVLLHLVVAVVTPFGIHRDELLYAAMGRHLRLFAMDFPPFIAMVHEARHLILGDAVWAMRALPALVHGAVVLVTARVAQQFGGERTAMLLAAVAVASTPFLLRAGTLFQPVIFEQLWWTLILAALARIASTEEEATRTWASLGALAGVALLTKFSIVFLGAGVALALAVLWRRALASRGPWLALGLAFAVGAPSWIGQLALDWPVLHQMADLRSTQLVRVTYPAFLGEQLLLHGPAAVLVAAIGLAALVGRGELRRWRVVGAAIAATFVLLMVSRGKPYYAGALFPTLIAAGAVPVARRLRTAGQRALVTAALVLPAVVLLPIAVPLVGPETTVAYAARLGIASKTNTGEPIALEQDFADMLGWERTVALVAEVYDALPIGERRETVLVGTNYGRAGALDYFGPRHGLPPAIAPVGSYWFFGPGAKPGRTLLLLGGAEADLAPLCGELHLARRISEAWAVAEEQDVPVWLCRAPRMTLQEIWPGFAGRN